MPNQLCSIPDWASPDAANVLLAVNAARGRAGIACLQLDDQLSATAQNHSTYMALNGELTHEESPGLPGFTGATFPERIRAALPWASDIGELIAAGFGNGSALVDAYLTSPSATEILLRPDYDWLGVGQDEEYWTLNFARVTP